MELREALTEDLPRIAGLLVSAGLPGRGIAAAHCFVAAAGGEVAAAAGLEPYGDVGLLRSVVVAPAHRGRGLGRRLCERVAERAAELGVRELYLLTLDARDYFAALGFTSIDRQAAPSAIRACEEFRVLCPDSAVLMRRRLP